MILLAGMVACNPSKKESTGTIGTYENVKIVGAMKNVMWKGELAGSIDLDTISNKKGLYGIGPESFLTGELLIKDGENFVSRVTSDTTMAVAKTFVVSSPFFVYANVDEWEETALPKNIRNIAELERFINEITLEEKRPIAFKLTGKASKAAIHVQNLPKGTKVTSPDEAHQGQTDYTIKNENVEIIGFFSTEHKGIFTHHHTFLHMHLITEDETQMGHLDELEIEDMKLYLPKK